MNTEQALKAMSALPPSERVDLLFVVSSSPSPEVLRAYSTAAERIAKFDAHRKEALEPLIAAIRRRQGMKIVNDSRNAGHLVVRGKASDFVDEASGLIAEIRELPIDVYTNEAVVRAI